ncbi:SDR family NAD(P)-dependent oxidoreductase [Vibrio sp. 10N.261.51.F12]|uniref:SDR family NAD(P)-dependent oxidoreductase n=1 Tax=Vibrio sp. 10N.261.51.F12 TaxID=3229679 RepID=UPI003552CE5B
MQKSILVTGATDGIGLETVKMLVTKGHHVIVHGRSADKVQHVKEQLIALDSSARVDTIVADLSVMSSIDTMVTEVSNRFSSLDVLINNAGVFNTVSTITANNLDVRFAVNTLAPYILTSKLIPLMAPSGRIVNLSSAAQSTVNLDALAGNKSLSHGEAYAQSKLALTMWSRVLGLRNKVQGPMIVSVNPKSLLGSKMVQDAYGIAGSDLSVGADILVRASLSEEFAQAHGQYYDNDIEAFAPPHRDALDDTKAQEVIDALDIFWAGR